MYCVNRQPDQTFQGYSHVCEFVHKTLRSLTFYEKNPYSITINP